MAHVVHLAGHESQRRLRLSAIRLLPSQTPSEFTPTHEPPDVNVPEAQTMQSLEVPPVHVWHDDEQGEQELPLLNEPSGQAVPLEVTERGGLHFVRSLPSWVKPDLHARQTPVPSAHRSHPNWQTWQSPVEVRKKPAVHFPHAVPSSAVVKPELQVHWPFEPQTPFKQLHEAGGFATEGFRH
jgi:hypothetical protein